MLIKKVIGIVCRNLFYLLVSGASKLSRNRKKYILFGSNSGFSDNAKYLYLEFLDKGIENAYWVAKSKKDEEFLKRRNLPYVVWSKAMWVRIVVDAKAAFFTHGINDIAPALPNNVLKINLWHGTPLKRIGYDSVIDFRKSKLRKYIGFSDVYSKWNYMLASSSSSLKILSKATGLPAHRFIKARQPRNEILFNSKENAENTYVLKFALYLPTFRDSGEVDHINEFIDIWKDVYAVTGIKLCIKLHPFDLKKVNIPKTDFLIQPCDVVHDSDVQVLLLRTACLITDYSSVIFDYLILKKPILFYVPDLTKYQALRGGNFYIELNDVLVGNAVNTYRDIVDVLVNNKSGPSALLDSGLLNMVDDKSFPSAFESVIKLI